MHDMFQWHTNGIFFKIPVSHIGYTLKTACNLIDDKLNEGTSRPKLDRKQ
jgi:hypothetical protein